MGAIVYGVSGPRLWVGGYELSQWASRTDIKSAFEQQDDTTFSAPGAKAYVPGLETVTFDHSGFFEAVAASLDGSDDALSAYRGLVDVPISFTPLAGAEGDVAFTFRSGTFTYSAGGQVGEVMPYKASGVNSGGRLYRGTVLRATTLVATGSANGTGRQLGALVAGQTAHASLHVGSCTGTTPQVTALVYSSPDNTFATPTLRMSFAATGTNTYATASVSGPVTDTWWRVSTTVTGTTPSIPVFVAFGIR